MILPKRVSRRSLGLMLFVPAALTVISACGGGVPSEPEQTIELSSFTFSGIESLAINSDVIVLGTVSKVEPGRTVGEDPEQIQYRDVSIKVEKTILDRLDSPQSSVIVQELGWSSGKTIQPADLPWSEEGDRGYFFLQQDVPGKFGYLGSQARMLIDANTVEAGGAHELRQVDEINDTTPAALGVKIEAAAAKIKTENIPNPEGPAMGDPEEPGAEDPDGATDEDPSAGDPVAPPTEGDDVQ
jgi:hypothetical protein